MVLKSMKSIIRILLFQFLIFLFSCEEHGLFVKCSECLADEPLKANLELSFNNSNYSSVKVSIYEGNIEDNILYTSFTIYGEESTTVSVRINKMYSATATYSVSNDNIVVVDAAIPRVTYSEDQCDEPCYYVYDKKLDLRLK